LATLRDQLLGGASSRRQVLPAGQVLIDGRVLSGQADYGPHQPGPSHDIQAEHARLPGVGFRGPGPGTPPARRIRAYRDVEVSEADTHLWQQCNPVVTEALVQLTWGGPQVIYNGGLQQARIRYYDAGRRRPGLPASVAALVSSIDPQATLVDLVDLDPEHDRTVIVQAAAFAEHTLQAVGYTACPDRSLLGSLYDSGHRARAVTERHAEVRTPWLAVRLPASTRVRLTLTPAVRTRPLSYTTPFDGGPRLPSPGKSHGVPGRWCHGPFGIDPFIRTDPGASPGAGPGAAAGEASRSAGQGHG